MASRVVQPFPHSLPTPQARQDEAAQKAVDSLGLTRRMRRNRKADWSRRLVRETVLTTADLIWPLFLVDSSEARSAIAWMPGVDRLNIEEAVRQAVHAAELGIPAIAPFPFVEKSLRDESKVCAWGSASIQALTCLGRISRSFGGAARSAGKLRASGMSDFSSKLQRRIDEEFAFANQPVIAVITGLRAFRNPCFQITACLDNPFA